MAGRSCHDCQRYLYDDREGVMGPQRKGRDARGQLTVLQYRYTGGTPCHQCPKIPYGMKPARENGVEVTEQVVQAYHHNRECAAVGAFPDDEIVRRNARLIASVLDEAERTRAAKTDALLTLLSLRMER